MPVVTSYPGIYIQELPSNTHTIAAAPTSVTVFVGYVHPFKTAPSNFKTALEIFSFSDYERLFGGFYQSSVIDANVSYAVNEFFENGGTDAYVVGLQPTQYYDGGGVAKGAFPSNGGTLALDTGGVVFTALEPTDVPATATSPGTVMNISIANVQAADTRIADITITYGTQQEVYRKVTLDNTNKQDFLETRINKVSALVTVAGGPYPAAFTADKGTIAQVAPVGATNVFHAPDFAAVFQADSSLDKVQVFNLLLTPGIVDNGVLSEALAFCERKLAFFIMDPPKADIADPPTNWVGDFLLGTPDTGGNVAPLSPNGALYFPYLQSSNPVTGLPLDANGNPFTLPPSGYVAGIYAATDSGRGVWKAPAGFATTLIDTTGVVTPGGLMTDTRQGVLNLIGVNCIRSFPGAGTVVFGARTLVSANTALQQWKYVPVRRMALFLEQTLKANLTWVIFEPNDDPLWVSIRTSIESFMLSLFNQGAFAGTTPSDAFQVKCDNTTTTPDDQANGVVNIIVGFAPLRPAEFVVVKIAQLAGQAQS
jgi:uncharacterized protein